MPRRTNIAWATLLIAVLVVSGAVVESERQDFRQEFMTFMEAELDRLDRDKSAELDARELTQSRLRVNRTLRAR